MGAQLHIRATRDSALNLSFLNQRNLHFLATLNHTRFYTTPTMCLATYFLRGFFSVSIVLNCVCRLTLTGTALDWKCVGRRRYRRWNSFLWRSVVSSGDPYILGLCVNNRLSVQLSVCVHNSTKTWQLRETTLPSVVALSKSCCLCVGVLTGVV